MTPELISRALVLGGLVITLGGVGARARQYEAAIASGERLYLRTVGVDPRSIIEGDYLVFRLLPDAPEPPAPSGSLILRREEGGVATFVRYGDEAQAPDERVVRYHVRSEEPHVAPESWFIEEGTADLYRDMAFAELRLTSTGRLLLVGLADDELRRVGPGRKTW